MALESEPPAIDKDKIQTSAQIKDVIGGLCDQDMGNGEDVIEELTRQNTRMSIIQQIVKRINVEMSYEDILDKTSNYYCSWYNDHD